MNRRHRKTLVAVGLVVATTLTAGVFYSRRGDVAPDVTFGAVTRGSIVSTVAATGTLEAVTTVLVGSQLSGSIQSLHADYNSIVRKGQVLARLDPSLYQSAIDQARANLGRSEAERDRLDIARADASAKRQRARELSERQLIPRTELEGAEMTVRAADAQVRSAEAQVTQARAALRQAEVNLAKAIITSPIDGIVIARNVDAGQTVAASLQAPTLFVLAADLGRMQLKANVDEADLGNVAEGQPVTFTVDAYPRDAFTGTVQQVRLNPVVEQNVVTYAAIITAPNPDLKLKPGMTASLTIEIARRDDVLRVPAAALRVQPSPEVREALGAGSLDVRGSRVWQIADGRLRAVPVTTGASDGTFMEIAGGELAEGAAVVTRVAVASTAPARLTGNASPLMPSGPPRRGG